MAALPQQEGLWPRTKHPIRDASPRPLLGAFPPYKRDSLFSGVAALSLPTSPINAATVLTCVPGTDAPAQGKIVAAPFSRPLSFYREENRESRNRSRIQMSTEDQHMSAICVICDADEATPRCKTCRKCRAYIHRWSAEKDDRIVGHFDKLRVRVRRLNTFAVVTDESVNYVDFRELQEQKIIFLSKKEMRRAKAHANVISIKAAHQRAKTSVTSMLPAQHGRRA